MNFGRHSGGRRDAATRTLGLARGGLILAVASLAVAGARAEDVVIVRSREVGPYLEAINGAQRALQGVSVALVELGSSGDLRADIKSHSPRVVLTVGRAATQAVLDLKLQLPVVYCMVLDPGELEGTTRPAAGVHLQIPVSDQLRRFRELVPSLTRVAVIYDPSHSRELVEEAEEAAEGAGLELVALPVRSLKEVFPALRSLRERKADALWMVLDSTVYNRDSIEGILRFTLENHIAFMASDRQIVKGGALCALSPRFDGVGMQAAGVVRALLAGVPGHRIEERGPEDYGLYVNEKTARHIQVELSPDVLANAVEVFR